MRVSRKRFAVKKIMCDGVGFIQVKPDVWKLYDGFRTLRALTCDTEMVMRDFVEYNFRKVESKEVR